MFFKMVTVSNKYRFQGKELQDEHGLYCYDFGARMYDQQLGRWHCADPAEQFSSPYMAMGNNPINTIDPNGMVSIGWSGHWLFAFLREWENMRRNTFKDFEGINSLYEQARLIEYLALINEDEGSAPGGQGNDNEGNNEQDNDVQETNNNPQKDGKGNHDDNDMNFLETSLEVLSNVAFQSTCTIGKNILNYRGISANTFISISRFGANWLSNIAVGAVIYLNTSDVVTGDINAGRYAYRMTGTGLTYWAASELGGWLGLGVALFFWGAEYSWDNAIVPAWEEIKYQYREFERSWNAINVYYWMNNRK